METVIIDVYHIFNVLVLVDNNYKNILEERKKYQCDYNLLIIVEEYAYNYYKNLFNINYSK